jgi:hypothetical protein
MELPDEDRERLRRKPFTGQSQPPRRTHWQEENSKRERVGGVDIDWQRIADHWFNTRALSPN